MIALPKCRTIRHNFLRIMKLVESMRGFIVPLLAIIAGFLISLPSEGQTGKRLSASDLKNIDDITQVAMNAALARDFATWASLFLEDAVTIRPMSRQLKDERRFALGWRNFHR